MDLHLLNIEIKNKLNNLRYIKELDEIDLEYKILIIVSFIQEINNKKEKYNSITLNMHILGLCEILKYIKKELDIINNEYEYIKSSWFYYFVGWTYYKSNINIQNIKKQTNVLNNRYDMLLKILSIQKN